MYVAWTFFLKKNHLLLSYFLFPFLPDQPQRHRRSRWAQVLHPLWRPLQPALVSPAERRASPEGHGAGAVRDSAGGRGAGHGPHLGAHTDRPGEGKRKFFMLRMGHTLKYNHVNFVTFLYRWFDRGKNCVTSSNACLFLFPLLFLIFQSYFLGTRKKLGNKGFF